MESPVISMHACITVTCVAVTVTHRHHTRNALQSSHYNTRRLSHCYCCGTSSTHLHRHHTRSVLQSIHYDTRRLYHCCCCGTSSTRLHSKRLYNANTVKKYVTLKHILHSHNNCTVQCIISITQWVHLMYTHNYIGQMERMHEHLWYCTLLNAHNTPPTSFSVVASRALPSVIADAFTTSGLVAVSVRAVPVLAWISAGLCRTRTESKHMQLVTLTRWCRTSRKYTLTKLMLRWIGSAKADSVYSTHLSPRIPSEFISCHLRKLWQLLTISHPLLHRRPGFLLWLAGSNCQEYWITYWTPYHIKCFSKSLIIDTSLNTQLARYSGTGLIAAQWHCTAYTTISH